MPGLHDVFSEWRKADAQARASEERVFSAQLDALGGGSESATPADEERARELRKTADALLALVFVQLEPASEEEDGRKSPS
jgi:hypothetical protein